MTTAAITTENLGKRFGAVWAAREVSFEVQPGEVVGFIGRNGAGKTTVMRMIASLLNPTIGRVLIQRNFRLVFSPKSP
jgi:ABC-type multidrug transport system ATPase subunit